jgi:hypothetical protein
LGYPDQAKRVGHENPVYAKSVGHPFDWGFSLGFGSSVFHFLDDTATLLRHGRECAAVGAEHNLPFIQYLQASIPVTFARAGSPATNERAIGELVALFESLCVHVTLPYYRCLMAEQVALDGRLDEAAQLADAAIERVEGPAAAERVYYPEMLRLRASIANATGDLHRAEALLEVAISVAREQSARSWELRAATDLARLMVITGRRSEALRELRPIYDWFTEGRDTKDHIEARQLLQELGG